MDPIQISDTYQRALDEAAREANVAAALATQLAQQAEQARAKAEQKIAEFNGALRMTLKVSGLNPDGYTADFDGQRVKVTPKDPAPAAPEAVPSANSTPDPADQ